MPPELETLLTKADAVHVAALNLASTLGIFHGINDVLRERQLRGRPSHAVGTIQFDLLQIMVIRVCALCEGGRRPDDASMPVLLGVLNDRRLREVLIEKDRRWRKNTMYRIPAGRDAAANIRSLKIRWAALKRNESSLTKLRHLRNKQLGHVTIGFEKNHRALLKELWTLTDRALSVARYIRLVFHQIDCDYQDARASLQKDGKALVDTLTARGDRKNSQRADNRNGRVDRLIRRRLLKRRQVGSNAPADDLHQIRLLSGIASRFVRPKSLTPRGG